MKSQERRDFLKKATAASLLSAMGTPGFGKVPNPIENSNDPVSFSGDGLYLSPNEYSQLLTRLTTDNAAEADNYSLGGCVEALETKFATLLGKEAAIFMPTGTLANQLALRALCHEKSSHRVIIQHESHIYNDTGDACQLLSNLNLIPLGANRATFTLDEVEEVVKRTAGGRVAARVGAISIESPVRRKMGEVFDFAEMKKIAAFAKANDIGMHLDGARLFLATPYTGVKVTDYSSLFDTVYVSLYKYFNAASGAILAGPKSLIAPMYHTRRMFGSGLPQSWPFALVAGHFAEGFPERFAKAVTQSETLIKRLATHPQFEIQRIPEGTNLFRLTIKGVPAKTLAETLKTNGVIARADSATTLLLSVNESILRRSADELEAIFVKSLNS
ncbi:threonine aldolase family protein [Salmonirosea aquatica]|uniref:Twin-arginine translocation signal domain-containing protein n=1 Tax=Salmonirosea aquatica TaxID=2654236 RepID=A0A7C9FZ59_9BACT|nr:twin-arginine translocation signal domain-containing protein [Cytophagaceae bacterium SJW1-29]